MKKFIALTISTILTILACCSCGPGDTGTGNSVDTATGKSETAINSTQADSDELILPGGYKSYSKYWFDNTTLLRDLKPAHYEFNSIEDGTLENLDAAMYNFATKNMYLRVTTGEDTYEVLLTNPYGEGILSLGDGTEESNVTFYTGDSRYVNVNNYGLRWGYDIGYLKYMVNGVMAVQDGIGDISFVDTTEDYGKNSVNAIIEFHGLDEISKFYGYVNEDFQEDMLGLHKSMMQANNIDPEKDKSNLRLVYTIDEDGLQGLGCYVYFGEPKENTDWENCFTYWIINWYVEVDDWSLSHELYEMDFNTISSGEDENGETIINDEAFAKVIQILQDDCDKTGKMIQDFFDEEFIVEENNETEQGDTAENSTADKTEQGDTGKQGDTDTGDKVDTEKPDNDTSKDTEKPSN